MERAFVACTFFSISFKLIFVAIVFVLGRGTIRGRTLVFNGTITSSLGITVRSAACTFSVSFSLAVSQTGGGRTGPINRVRTTSS